MLLLHLCQGELDLIKPLLERVGTVHFGRLNMKPGKPTTFATIGASGASGASGAGGGEGGGLVFALPGNPVSCLVTTHLLLRPVRRACV